MQGSTSKTSRRDELEAAGRRFVLTHGRPPKKHEFNSRNGLAREAVIREHFGNLSNFQRAVAGKASVEVWDESRALEVGVRWMVDNGSRLPKERDLGRNGLLSRSAAERLFGSVAGYQAALGLGRADKIWTPHTAIASGRRWTVVNDRHLSYRTLRSDPELPSVYAIKRLWPDEQVGRYLTIINGTGWVKEWSPVSAGLVLWRFSQRHLRPPTRRDLETLGGLPSRRTVDRIYGSVPTMQAEIETAADAAGYWSREEARALGRAWIRRFDRLPQKRHFERSDSLPPWVAIEDQYGDIDSYWRSLGQHPEGGELMTRTEMVDRAQAWITVHGALPPKNEWDIEASVEGRPLPYLDEIIDHYESFADFAKDVGVRSSRTAQTVEMPLR